MKIHYINEIANFCEKAGADVSEVAKGMGLDSRIGPKFLNAGLGFGGSCFPKDTMAMAYMGRMLNTPIELIETTINGNKKRKKQMAERILEEVKDIPNAKIGVLGLAFKNGTDDCRQSPAMDIIEELLQHHVDVIAYDPKAMGTACQILGDKINYADDMYAVARDADILVILTEWPEFSDIDLDVISQLMNHKVILDFRNMLNKEKAISKGFKYQSIGR
jgi:UDPglucose 6-dehydrogenase